jgi:alpha-beta hydrolase superfamily lysophospholipase
VGEARLVGRALAALVAALSVAVAAPTPAGANPPEAVTIDVGAGARVAGEWFAGSVDTLVVVVAPRAPARDPARAEAAEAFRAAGFSVLTFDYRDVDSKTGTLPDSVRFVVYASRWVDDMVGALRFARERTGPRGRVFAWGQETGSNVAIAAAGRSEGLADAVVVEGLFRNVGEHLDLLGTGVMPEIVQQHRRLVLDKDQPATAMSRYAGPVFVVMAGRDSVTPVMTTKDVYRGRRALTEIFSLPEAGHGDAAKEPGYYRTVANWLRKWRFARSR